LSRQQMSRSSAHACRTNPPMPRSTELAAAGYGCRRRGLCWAGCGSTVLQSKRFGNGLSIDRATPRSTTHLRPSASTPTAATLFCSAATVADSTGAGADTDNGQ
jgi:hypothetical protein